MVESREERAGGLWKSLGGPNLLCDNCRKELPINATFGKGKHAVLDQSKGRLQQYCTSCYYYFIHKDDPDIRKQQKLR